MNFQELKLDDKDFFDQYFQQRRFEISESTFANLYIWRDCFLVRYAVEENIICLNPTIKDENFLVPLIGADTSGVGNFIEKCREYFQEKKQPFLLKGVTQEVVDLLEKAKPDTFNYESDRDVSDYLYSAETLMTLAGRKFSRKRNHIKNFKKNFPQYEYKNLSEDLIPEAIEFVREWCRKKGCEDDKSLMCERDAAMEAFNNFTTLGLTGGVILIDGKIEAVTYGEALNEDTVIIHLEKGSADFNGIYPVINQEYLKHNWHHMTYVNREEDLGIPELRKAKEAYYPLRLIEKYRVTLK